MKKNTYKNTRHTEFKFYKLFADNIGGFSNFLIQNSLNGTSSLRIYPVVHFKEDLDHSNFFTYSSFESSKLSEENSLWHFLDDKHPKVMMINYGVAQ